MQSLAAGQLADWLMAIALPKYGQLPARAALSMIPVICKEIDGTCDKIMAGWEVRLIDMPQAKVHSLMLH